MRLGLDPEITEELKDGDSLTRPSASTFGVAARRAPVELRSLDGAHLAAAGEVGSELEAQGTYERRMVAGV